MALLTATNGNVQLSAGALSDIPNGAYTVAVVFRRHGTTTDGYEAITALVSSGSTIVSLGTDATASPYALRFVQGGATRTFAFSESVDNDAYVYVVRRPAGTSTPRANLYRLDAGSPAWDGWLDASGTVDDRADVIDAAWLLNQPGGFPLNGGVWVVAYWDGLLSEADITDSVIGLHLGVQQWLDINPALGPVMLVRPGETNPVEDESDSGTSDETSRSGVTIVDEDPTGFDMEFSAGGVTGTITASLPALENALDGVAIVDGTLGATLPELAADLDGAATAAGDLDAELPSLGSALTGEVRADGTLSATLPALESDLSGATTAAGQLAATLSELTGALSGDVLAGGVLSAMLPELTSTLVGDAIVEGALGAELPSLSSALAGVLAVDGELNTTLPAITTQFDGTVEGTVTGELEAQLPSLSAALTGTSSATPPTSGVDLMTLAFMIVTGVGECVREELEDTEGGVPNRFCLLVPGDIAWDECQCGQFAQTITTDTPSNAFPAPATDQRATACGPNLLVVTVVASLTRCVPTIGRDNKPPSCGALLEAARILEDDRQALRTAVTCCLRELRQARRVIDFAVGATTAVGPQGMCAGVEMTYQFAVPNVCC